MRVFLAAIYLFLYAPIALVVVFSFNAGRSATQMTAFLCNGTARRCRTSSSPMR